MEKRKKIEFVNDFLNKDEKDITSEEATKYVLYLKDLAKDIGYYSELLGREYFDGKYVKKNLHLVLHYFEKAYYLRNPNVVMPLANMYKNGIGGPVDSEGAFLLYMGEYLKDTEYRVECALELYEFYYNGIYVRQDLEIAKSLLKSIITRANIDESFEGIHVFHRVAYHYAFATYRMAHTFNDLYDALKYAYLARKIVKKDDEYYDDFTSDLDKLIQNIYDELKIKDYKSNNFNRDFMEVDEIELEAILANLGEHVSLISSKKLEKDVILLRFNGTNLYEAFPFINYVGKVTYVDILLKGVDIKDDYFNDGQSYCNHAFKVQFANKINSIVLADDNDLAVKVELNIKGKLEIMFGEVVSDEKNNGKFKRIKNKHYLDNELDEMLNSFIDDNKKDDLDDDFIEA